MPVSKTLKVTKDEWTFFGNLIPYLAMILGAILTFALAAVTRLGIKAQHLYLNNDIITASYWITGTAVVSGFILCYIAWRLFSQRKGMFIKHHAGLTVLSIHVWFIWSVWDNTGDWLFGASTMFSFFYGGLVIVLSWCIRRWAFREESNDDQKMVNPFEQAGLGNAWIDHRSSQQVSEGVHKFRLMLPVGKTIEDAKSRLAQIAHIAGKPRALLHIAETAEGIEGQAEITVLAKDPFKDKAWWQGPDFPGESIVEPITYATYDTGQRPELYLAGKNGASSQHYLTMGMSGAGKSKAWQAIYGSVLTRTEVSVIFGDPAKGMQTGGPLASGLEWFATTEEECLAQIHAIINAIPVRTDYLTSRGLDHWESGCGLNFIIFHLEEAARFAEVDELVQMIEAARSAGICIIISLQRATNDRLKTSARYNLGGNMCFGVKMKRDASFGLSEYAIEAGARPHSWQDRKPGFHYLEATGLDATLAGHPLRTDWLDLKRVEREINAASAYRTPLDETTSNVLGAQYVEYRMKVMEGSTNWQQMRSGRRPVAKDQEFGFQTDPKETAAYREHLRSIIEGFHQNNQYSFTPKDIWNAGFEGRSKGWLTQNLSRLVDEGVLEYSKDTKFYTVVQ